jgi:hypothetical protein
LTLKFQSIVAFVLVLSAVASAGQTDRRELARFGNIDVIATVSPDQRGHLSVSVGFRLNDLDTPMLKRSGLTSEGAEQFVHGVTIQQCKSQQPGRFILRASAPEVAGSFYVIDQVKKEWGEYRTLSACPAPQAEPSAWHKL